MRLYTYAWMHYTFCLSELSYAISALDRGAGIPNDKLFTAVPTPPHAAQTYLRATWETNVALMKSELIKINIRPDDSKVDILLDLLKKRAAKETIMGICDAVAVDPVCLDDVDAEVVAKYRSFVEPQWNGHIKRKDEGQGLVIGFKTFSPPEDGDAEKTKSKRKSPSKKPAPENGLNQVDQRGLKHDPVLAEAMTHTLWVNTPEERREPSDPFPLNTSTLSTATPETSQFGHQSSETMDTPRLRDVWIPVIFGEYKRRSDDSPMKAVGQARSYICTGLNFMSSVGVRDHPVMSLVTNGTRGAVIMGWKSSQTDVRFICVISFDEN